MQAASPVAKPTRDSGLGAAEEQLPPAILGIQIALRTRREARSQPWTLLMFMGLEINYITQRWNAGCVQGSRLKSSWNDYIPVCLESTV